MTRRNILGLAVAAALRGASLPEQSAALVLDHNFPDPHVSYLLLDVPTGRTIAARWNGTDEPAPVGSLVKPFTAVAYGQSHEFRFPVSVCKGDRCWYERGHGQLDIVHAIAHSCNAYFLDLAAGVDQDALEPVAQKFGIPAPAIITPEALIGLGGVWQISPIAMVRAYIELVNRSIEPILTGMALSARAGTGRGVGSGAYVKTGTQRGDGYVIALYPIASPRHALLVRQSGAPGALAAYVCGRMKATLGA